MDVDLSPDQVLFIERAVASGRFPNANEALRAAVTLLEEQEHNLDRLRQAIEQGDSDIEQGRTEELTQTALHDFFTDVKRRGAERLNQ